MDELVMWLREQLDADEAAARLCAEMFPAPWEVADRGWRVRIYSAEVPDEGDHAEPGDMRVPCVMEVEPTRHHDDTRWLSERVEHVARHNPARVLADVEAKRAIIELAEEANGLDMQVDSEFRVGSRDTANEPYVGDLIIRNLAEAYADRPGYREEWRTATFASEGG